MIHFKGISKGELLEKMSLRKNRQPYWFPNTLNNWYQNVYNSGFIYHEEYHNEMRMKKFCNHLSTRFSTEQENYHESIPSIPSITSSKECYCFDWWISSKASLMRFLNGGAKKTMQLKKLFAVSDKKQRPSPYFS